MTNWLITTRALFKLCYNVMYWSTLQWIFSGTNENIEKALHTLLAYYLLHDIVQFVQMSVVTQGLLTRLNEYCQFFI